MTGKKDNTKKNQKVNKIADLLENARNSFTQGNFRRTVSFCEKAALKIKSSNDNETAARLYFTWVLAVMKLNDYESIPEIVEQAEQNLGNYLDLSFFRVIASSGNGEDEKTIAFVDEFAQLHKLTDPDADKIYKQSYNSLDEVLWMGAEAAKKLSQIDQALDYMKRSLALKPDNHLHRIQFVELLVENDKGDKALAILDESIENYPGLIVLRNVRGMILGKMERFKDAEKYLKELLKIYPDNPDALNNLGVIYDKQGLYDKARGCFEKALNVDPGNKQAEKNLEYIKRIVVDKPPTISACMIVKNEEKFLPGCLDSIKGLVDEIIIVDTGSTDRTMEIAREYGAKIYEHPWQDDFSFHRNQSMGYAACDWILIIDADEEFEPAEQENIKMTLKRKGIDGLSFVVYNEISHDRVGCLTSKRIFRNHKGYKYEGIVHNQIRISGNVVETDYKVIHHGYDLSKEGMEKKSKRSKELLLKQIEENPEYTFAYFNLAQIYRGEGNFQKCLEYSTNVVENSSFEDVHSRHLYLMGLDQMGCSQAGLSQYEKAIATFTKALKYKSDFLDSLFNLGYTYFNMGKHDEAKEHLLRYLKVKETYSLQNDDVKLMLSNISSEHIAYYLMGFMDLIKERYESAIDKFNKALEYIDDIRDIHNLLARCYRAKNDYSKTIDHCAKAIIHGHEDAELRLLEGDAYVKSGDALAARNSFNRALELKPDEQEAMIGIISASKIDKNPAEVLKLIDGYLDISPSSPRVLASRGDMLFDLGEYHIAKQSYLDSQEQDPGDYRVLNNLGNCYLKEKNYGSAEACYKSALGKNKDFIPAYRNLAVSLIQQGKHFDGSQYLEYYLGLNPNDGEVHATLGDIYYNSKEYYKALLHFEKYLMFDPKNMDVLIRISDCYFNLGKLEAAAFGYKAVLKKDITNEIAQNRLKELNSYSKPRICKQVSQP